MARPHSVLSPCSPGERYQCPGQTVGIKANWRNKLRHRYPALKAPCLGLYLPEVPDDGSICPRVFCVEAQQTILAGDKSERFVKPPAGVDQDRPKLVQLSSPLPYP